MQDSKISEKPIQLYEFIEDMVPSGPYLELFGSKNNQREGWITVGDEAINYKSKLIRRKNNNKR